MLSYSGLSKAEVLLALYYGAKKITINGEYESDFVSLEEAKGAVEFGDVKSFHGRIIMVDFSCTTGFDETRYNRENGKNRAQKAIKQFKEKIENIRDLQNFEKFV